jgi:hypothetical protein
MDRYLTCCFRAFRAVARKTDRKRPRITWTSPWPAFRRTPGGRRQCAVPSIGEWPCRTRTSSARWQPRELPTEKAQQLIGAGSSGGAAGAAGVRCRAEGGRTCAIQRHRTAPGRLVSAEWSSSSPLLEISSRQRHCSLMPLLREQLREPEAIDGDGC